MAGRVQNLLHFPNDRGHLSKSMFFVCPLNQALAEGKRKTSELARPKCAQNSGRHLAMAVSELPLTHRKRPTGTGRELVSGEDSSPRSRICGIIVENPVSGGLF